MLIILKLSYFGKTIRGKRKFYNFGLLHQVIDSWFMNHKPLIPTLPYTILPLFFIVSWIPEGKRNLLSPLKEEGVRATDLHHGKHSLHPACCPEVYTFFFNFYSAASWPTFWGIIEGTTSPPVLIACVLLILTLRSLGASWWSWVPNLCRAPARIEPGTFWF